ncbi:TPA: ead/Ea22-like family protein [Escherichia coli]
MSKIDYQALREKAEKATSGVWSLEYGEERFDAGDALIHREVVGYLPICRIEGAHPESGFDEDFQMEQQANAEFIAAANPATVLELLDELEAVSDERAAYELFMEKRFGESVDRRRAKNGDSEYMAWDMALGWIIWCHRATMLQSQDSGIKNGWISCSERMPNDAQWCVVDAEGGYYVQCWSEGQGWLGDDISLRDCDVIRWMPLPEPPQEVK